MSDTKSNVNMFSVALKSVAFAWQTNRGLLIVLLLLNVFQGSVIYLQFTSFSAIVDEIIRIKAGTGTTQNLMVSSVTLALSFLIPSFLSNVVSHFRSKFRLQQGVQLELYKIDKQSSLDIGTIESNSYQTLLRCAQEWGSGSVINVHDFIFTSATSLAGV